jgi:hypothetical protein
MALPGTTKGIDGAAIPYVIPIDEFGNSAGAASAVSRIPSSANTNNATVAKASPGTLKSIDAVNTTGAVIYLKFYNKATAPTVGTDVPLLTIALPANGARSVALNVAFSVGISYALVTGAADSDNTAVGAGAVIGLNVAYA